MLIRDVLSIKNVGEILDVAPDAPVTEAVKRLVEHGVGSLVVLQGDTLVGLITERDILRAMNSRGCSLIDARVSELMEPEPFVAGLEDSVDYARDAMTKNRISHLIVMEEGKLIGVISFHDLAKACLSEADFQNTLLKRYIKHWPE
jgi:CBS domain-containing protein